jgi:hypothetical protein
LNDFSPVWISTAEQLARLEASYRSASLLAKLLGRFAFPEGTAHVRGIVMPWARVPLVAIAQGRLTVAGDRLTFAATPLRVPGWLVRGMHDLHWELGRADVVAVDPADFASPFARMFDIPFTRLRTRRPGLLSEFLVCVGGRFLMPKIRARSLDLRQALHAFADGAGG